jgi:flagellar hook-basal body complex protein FliE
MIDPIGPLAAGQSDPLAGVELKAPHVGSSGVAAGAQATDFGTVLAGLMTGAADTLRAAEKTSEAGVLGQASVQQVVESVMAAEQTLQSVVAIRDKAVGAYLEISRMTI